MAKLQYQPIYDITKTFEENVELGPNKNFVTTMTSTLPDESFTLLGYKINFPFGTAACPTGADSRFVKQTFENGFDIVTAKTRRSVYYRPNEFPNVVHIEPGKIDAEHHFTELDNRTTVDTSEYETLTVANSYGNNSLDPEYWIPDAKLANGYPGEGQLLINSIVGTIQEGFDTDNYYADFAKTAVIAKEAGAKAIEINLSCPNVANEGVLCYDKDAVFQVCKLVKAAVGDTPLIAKLGYFPASEQALLEAIVVSITPYVAAISAINTLAAPVLTAQGNQAMPGKGRLKAGISGHAIKEVGLDMCRRLVEIRNRNKLPLEIISFGGVLTPADFHDYRKAGADAVLSGTGAMWNPNLAHEIKNSY